MQWFRMYSEFASDPKVQALSEVLQRRYIMLLCLKCNGDLTVVTDSNANNNGEVALRVLATALRITDDDLKVTVQELKKFGLIDDNWDIKNWEKRQYISDIKDPTNSERQKRYREKHNNGKRNGTVTAKKRPDTDTDSDTDIKENTTKELFPVDGKLFDEFWVGYPSRIRGGRSVKGGKQEAWLEYQKVIGSGEVTHEKLMEAAVIYRNSPDVREGATMDARRWLFRKRWNDELGEVQNGTGTNGFKPKSKHEQAVEATERARAAREQREQREAGQNASGDLYASEALRTGSGQLGDGQ